MMATGNLLLFVVAVIVTAYVCPGESHPSSPKGIAQRDAGAGETTAPVHQFINLASVERNPTPDGNRYTLRYTKQVDTLLFHFMDSISAPRGPDTLEEEADGVWAASFVVANSTGVTDPPSVIISDSEVYHMVILVLNNEGSNPESQTMVELPDVHMIPETEAVYTADEDVFIRAYAPRNSQTGELVSNMEKVFTGVKVNTNEFSLNFEDPELFSLGVPESLSDRIQANITIHTSTIPVSGYFQLITDVGDTGGSLVWFTRVSRHIIVRPADQPGPLPTGFLTSIDLGYHRTSPNGNPMKYCRAGTECLQSCFAMGQDISGADVKEVLPDGSLVDVEDITFQPVTIPKSRGVYWKFQAWEHVGNADGITTFKCSFSDDTNGASVFQMLDVLVTVDISINEELSTMEVQEDAADPSQVEVTLTCVVRGRPLPEVTFNGYVYRLYGASPDHIVNVSDTELIAIKTVTMDAAHYAQANSNMHPAYDPAPSCNTYSELHMPSVLSHTFTVPAPPGC